MKRYMNLGGNSGVWAYDIGPDRIDVMFSSGRVYRYSYASAGRDNVEQLKILAENGSGLNSFINRYVRCLYVR